MPDILAAFVPDVTLAKNKRRIKKLRKQPGSVSWFMAIRSENVPLAAKIQAVRVWLGVKRSGRLLAENFTGFDLLADFTYHLCYHTRRVTMGRLQKKIRAEIRKRAKNPAKPRAQPVEKLTVSIGQQRRFCTSSSEEVTGKRSSTDQ